MINIEYCDIEESIAVGDLFDQIGFFNSAEQTDVSGDSYVVNNWSIEVESLDGYYPIEGFRWTKPERKVKLTCDNDFVLICSPEHVVLRVEPEQDKSLWVKVGNLAERDLVITQRGMQRVKSINSVEGEERLCDIQVSIAHSYFADGILSHNSHFLTFLGANALRNKVDVLHYTFELSEAAVGVRYDSNLCDVNSSDVIDNKEKILEHYKNCNLGRLIIKEFPTNSASIYTIRSHIERLNSRGFNPGLIIIDYADIMRSTRQYDSLRHELKLIYEELRGFAAEKGIGIWTASQSNKEGSNAEVVDLSNMSEAYGKAFVADVVFGLSRKSSEKASGFGRLYIAKNRAGRDGIVFTTKIDTSKSMFELHGNANSLDDSIRESESDMKKALKAKWLELQKDKTISDKLKSEEPELPLNLDRVVVLLFLFTIGGLSMSVYSYEDALAKSISYFSGDELAARVFLDKYALRNESNELLECVPTDTQIRLAKEFARIEKKYPNPLSENEIFSYLSDIEHVDSVTLQNATLDELAKESKGFGAIVAQGSPMAGVGNRYQYQSLSNCFVIRSPYDSYGGIMRTDEEQAEIMKRRGGVGFDISTIRPKGMNTSNAARTTDGIGVFMKRYSDTCREVAQGGRRGALMITISCFEGSTLILTEDGWKRVDDIVDNKYSGRVWTHEGLKEIEVYQRFEDSEIYEVEAENGKVIKVTADHKFVVKNIKTGEEYLKAIKDVDVDNEELVFYDVSLHSANANKTSSKIKRISPAGRATSYDFTVKDTHRILANGFYTSNCNHPEVETFINIKRNLQNITGANISIRMNDEFMNAVQTDSEYTLRWPVDCKPENAKYTKTVKAKDIWEQIIDAAWFSAEPGVLFWDTAIRESPADIYEKFGFGSTSTNPCGEIILSPFDSCRLMVVNVAKFVNLPFKEYASFDYERFKKTVIVAQRLMDDLIDLEIEAVESIIDKIKNKDEEPDDIKQVELNLWNNVLSAARKGRRTGLGITGLGDAIAMLNVRYGSEKSLDIVESIYTLLANSAYKSSAILAGERGPFLVYDRELEKDHEFVQRVLSSDAELYALHAKNGRRNIALTTTAPVGSISMLTQTTSGIEPAYLLSYKRRKKINSNDHTTKVDFVDDSGDRWTEYDVYHHGFHRWMKETGKTNVEESPYQGSTSLDLDWSSGVLLQARAQKWICHSISRTSNLPKNVSHKVISDVYVEAWKNGCKGFTVYRQGSRPGVLLTPDNSQNWIDGIPNEELEEMIRICEKYEQRMPESYKLFVSSVKKKLNNVEDRPEIIGEIHAPKRPKDLKCDIHKVNVKGESYLVLVGLMNDKPYELFAGKTEHVEIPKKTKSGILTKNGKKDGVATYNLTIPLSDDDSITFKDIVNLFDNAAHGAFTRTISLALRHGVPVNYLVEQLRKDKYSDFSSFSKCIARVLSKTYIPDGTKATEDKACPSCGSSSLVYQSGCVTCSNCGNSKCG